MKFGGMRFAFPPYTIKRDGVGRLQRGDKIAIFLAVAFALLMISAPLWLPLLPSSRHDPNWGFGSDWNCVNPGIEPVCTKRHSYPFR